MRDFKGMGPGRGTLVQRKPDGLAPGKQTLVEAAYRDASPVSGAPSSPVAATGSVGSALPQPLQAKFGNALGADLGGVRVHASGDSAASAASVAARAYTVGQDIHFGAGEYNPGTPAEKRDALAELGRRSVLVEVHVKSTEDWTGADEVYVKFTGASGSHKTPVRSLNDGQRGSFLVPLAPFVPLTAPIKVEVFDEDWPDGDDLIVTMSWASPYQEIHNAASLDDADYEVRVRFA
jgi:hypothetical protein